MSTAMWTHCRLPAWWHTLRNGAHHKCAWRSCFSCSFGGSLTVFRFFFLIMKTCHMSHHIFVVAAFGRLRNAVFVFFFQTPIWKNKRKTKITKGIQSVFIESAGIGMRVLVHASKYHLTNANCFQICPCDLISSAIWIRNWFLFSICIEIVSVNSSTHTRTHPLPGSRRHVQAILVLVRARLSLSIGCQAAECLAGTTSHFTWLSAVWFFDFIQTQFAHARLH